MSERINTPFTNEHFVAFCEKMVGQPYWYGSVARRPGAAASRGPGETAADSLLHTAADSVSDRAFAVPGPGRWLARHALRPSRAARARRGGEHPRRL